ncbi:MULTISPECIES: tripartite tricarboxylate transporter substrate binding protein [unclassified Variovorax]|uniref:Bug family tripartite tricarboxylate transporter substrate binding protein n=1 Tax=unclassified Variovorax TaxID=663243 RepID=UPI001BD4298B|nr:MULTISPECIES: tripartite tricarboxylate transporter substrate binding protein [unclassified Variovorax]
MISLDSPRRRTLLAAAIGVLALGAAPVALAEAPWPDKPIHLVVPFPPGGGTDVMGRWVAQSLATTLKATVVVDNVPGATGTLGSAKVARADPDGYTILLGISATHAIAPAIYKDLSYRPATDFVAIGRVALGGNLLVAHPDFPANSVKELIEIARKPGSNVMVGSWGNGSGGHLALEAINQSTGVHMGHVPYKGVAPELNDLIGGQIQVAMVDVTSAAPFVKAGRIKALAVTGPRRSSSYPGVPTLLEQGVAFDTASWYGIFAPARTPAPVVDRLAQAVDAMLKQPEAAEKVRALGMEPVPIPREQFAQQVRDDIATWSRLVQAGNIKAD